MSIQSCLSRVLKYIKASGLSEHVSPREMRMFARQMEAVSEGPHGPISDAEFAAKMQEIIEERGNRARAINKAADVMILHGIHTTVNEAMGSMQKWQADWDKGKTGILGKWFRGTRESLAFEAVRTKFQGGSIQNGINARRSFPIMRQTLDSEFRNLLNNALKSKQGLKKLFETGAVDRKDILQEIWAIEKQLPEGQSKNPDALAVARAMKATMDLVFERKRAYNPRLMTATDYLVRQYHLREKILADLTPEGKQKWLSLAMETHDLVGERDGAVYTPDERLKIFEDIYERIKGGEFGSAMDDVSDHKFMNQSNVGSDIMKRQARGRQLIAKDWQASEKYSAQYGYENLYELMDRVMKSAAHDIGTMEMATANPTRWRDGVIEGMSRRLTGADKIAFDKKKPELLKMFNTAFGSQNSTADGLVAKGTQNAMSALYVARTQMSLFSSFPDINNAAMLIRALDGSNIASNAAEVMFHYAKGMADSAYAQDRLMEFNLWAETAHEAMLGIGGPAGTDKFATVMKQLGKLNLLERGDNALRAATATVLAKRLGDSAHLSHKELPGNFKEALLNYGIGEHEWRAMRGGTQLFKEHTLLTPEGVRSIGDVEAEYYLRATKQYTGSEPPSKDMLNYGRSRLAMKVSTLLNENATLAASRMDTRQRHALWGDTDINSAQGQIMRLITQFKSARFVTSDIQRRLHASGEGAKGDYAGIAHSAVMASFLWATGYYAKQIASGKTPEDPFTPEFALKMTIQSGFMGVTAEQILDGKSQGQPKLGLLQGLAGPVIGTAADVAAGVADAVSGGFEEGGVEGAKPGLGKLGRTAYGLLPVIQLPYTKALADAAFSNAVKEFMSPDGYLDNLEKQTGKTKQWGGGEQSYWLMKPTERLWKK